jgi:hypothetical protein
MSPKELSGILARQLLQKLGTLNRFNFAAFFGGLFVMSVKKKLSKCKLAVLL